MTMGARSFLAPSWILLGLLVALAGCRPKAELETLRLGLLVDAGSVDDKPVLNAAQLALDEVNQLGGLLSQGRRHRVELVAETSFTTPEEATEAARRLIHEHGVAALIGPSVSRDALRVGAMAEAARIPMISPGASHPAITAERSFVFRVTFSDQFQGEVMARLAIEDLEAPSAAVLFDVADTYSRGVAEVFRVAFESAGGRIVAFESFTTGEWDWSRQWQKIRVSRPAVVLLPNYNAVVTAQAPQARQLGVEAVMLGCDAWNPDELALISAFEGSYSSQHWHPSVAGESSRARDFLDAYRAAFGEDPNDMGALTYDAFAILFDAARREGIDPAALRRGLARTTDFAGVTGQLTYDETDGDPTKAAVILKLEGGRASLHRRILPSQM